MLHGQTVIDDVVIPHLSPISKVPWSAADHNNVTFYYMPSLNRFI